MVAATSAPPVTTVAFAARTVVRRGIAVRVVWIMPVLYSVPTARTARTAMTAWPSWTPVRLSLVASTVQPVVGQVIAATAAVLSAAVRVAAASSIQAGPATVRILGHYACM